MGTRLARDSLLTISGQLAVFRASAFVARGPGVLVGSALADAGWNGSAFIASVFSGSTAEPPGAVATGATRGSELTGGVLVSGAGGLTPTLFLETFAFAIMGYSLHTPKFRND